MSRRLKPHIPGLIYTGLLMVVAMAAMNNQNNLLFWVFGVLAAGLVVSAAMSIFVMRSLHVRRLDPRHGAVGEPLDVRYAVTNAGLLFSVFNIQIEERPPSARSAARRSTAGGAAPHATTDWRKFTAPAAAWVMHVAPRETVHGEAIFWPTRRGEIVFDRFHVSTTFPFGIFRRKRVISQPQHTLIYPMLYELRRGLLGAITPRGLLGSKVAQHAGAGDDYFGTREYKPGDTMRHIAWKRAAKTGLLVTIERTTPSPARMRVILDLTNPPEKLHVEPNNVDQARDLEERAISLAASLIHAANMEGYEVGLTVMGLRLPPIAVRRNQWHYNKIMAALAGLNLEGERAAERPLPVRDAERAAIVVITPDRVQPFIGREDAWYLTARQLDSLAVRPIGWDPNRRTSHRPTESKLKVEAAA